MVFQVPDDVRTSYVDKTGEEIEYSVRTLQAYKAKLNWLAKQGYDTPYKLMSQVYDIIPLIELDEHTMKAYQKRRLILSAIMWVLPDAYKEHPNPYWRLFQKSQRPKAADYVAENS